MFTERMYWYPYSGFNVQPLGSGLFVFMTVLSIRLFFEFCSGPSFQQPDFCGFRLCGEHWAGHIFKNLLARDPKRSNVQSAPHDPDHCTLAGVSPGRACVVHCVWRGQGNADRAVVCYCGRFSPGDHGHNIHCVYYDNTRL